MDRELEHRSLQLHRLLKRNLEITKLERDRAQEERNQAQKERNQAYDLLQYYFDEDEEEGGEEDDDEVDEEEEEEEGKEVEAKEKTDPQRYLYSIDDPDFLKKLELSRKNFDELKKTSQSKQKTEADFTRGVLEAMKETFKTMKENRAAT